MTDEELDSCARCGHPRIAIQTTTTGKPVPHCADHRCRCVAHWENEQGMIALATQLAEAQAERAALEDELISCHACGLCGGCLGSVTRHEDCEPCWCGHHDDEACPYRPKPEAT